MDDFVGDILYSGSRCVRNPDGAVYKRVKREASPDMALDAILHHNTDSDVVADQSHHSITQASLLTLHSLPLRDPTRASFHEVLDKRTNLESHNQADNTTDILSGQQPDSVFGRPYTSRGTATYSTHSHGTQSPVRLASSYRFTSSPIVHSPARRTTSTTNSQLLAASPENPAPISTRSTSKRLTMDIQLMDQQDVSEQVLNQIRTIYFSNGSYLPSRVKTWAQLKGHIVQHPVPKLDLETLALAQKHTFHAPAREQSQAATHIPTTGLTRPQEDIALTQAATSNVQPTPIRTDASTSIPPLSEAMSASASRMYGIALQQRADTATDSHARALGLGDRKFLTKKRPFGEESTFARQDTYSSPYTSPDSNTADRTTPYKRVNVTTASSAGVRTNTDTVENNTTTPYIKQEPDLGLDEFDKAAAPIVNKPIEHLNNVDDLLPANARPENPRLVNIKSAELHTLPLDQYSHLTLPDVICSILYLYDREKQEVLRALLDDTKAQHFFFMFKSRSDKYQSWSIERERSVVTVGIERPVRPPQAEAVINPSAGHFDLHVTFRLGPSTDVERPHSRPWYPCGTAFFPAQPHIFDFLHQTHPNRGAEAHHSFTFPSEKANMAQFYGMNTNAKFSSSDDPTFLECCGLLARYMQHTSLTTSCMNAEFQVAYGRKVRYDGILGRVRCNWENSIKGAKTTKQKREQAEKERRELEGARKAVSGDEIKEERRLSEDMGGAGGSGGGASDVDLL